MADKRINDLPAVESLADDGLLPVYQDGGAKRLTGAAIWADKCFIVFPG